MWSIFDFNPVSAEEFKRVMFSDGNSENIKVMAKVYKIIFCVYFVIGFISLVSFFRMRHHYMIKQMNFGLTFLNGLFAFISGLVTLAVQFVNLTCPVSLFSSNVINAFYNSIFLSRSLRMVLLYRFNIYKVNSMKSKNRITTNKFSISNTEPNNYLPRIYKVTNRIIYGIITLCTLAALTYTFVMLYLHSDLCPFTRDVSALQQIKAKGKQTQVLFNFAQFFGMALAFVMIIMIYFISKVEDNNKYGVKFECWTTAILIIVITAFNAILNRSVNMAKEQSQNPNIKDVKYPSKSFLTIYEYTNGGRVLFSLVSTYMIFACIILPCLRCWLSKRQSEKYVPRPVRSQQYFYRILNSPPILEKLEKIAIKEFSVENILFWKNYQILQKMVYVYCREYRKNNERERERNIDFERYFQDQMRNFSISSMESYSYDPYMPIPKEIYPYYLSFYYTYIDTMSPAAVNISGSIVRQILQELDHGPTVSIYDAAKK